MCSFKFISTHQILQKSKNSAYISGLLQIFEGGLCVQNKVEGVIYAKNPRFISKTYKVYYYQLIISCGDMTGHSGGNLT